MGSVGIELEAQNHIRGARKGNEAFWDGCSCLSRGWFFLRAMERRSYLIPPPQHRFRLWNWCVAQTLKRLQSNVGDETVKACRSRELRSLPEIISHK